MPRTFHRTEQKKEEKYEPVERVYRPLHKMVRDNFIGGLAWALGATLGITLIVAILGFALQYIDAIPLIGKTLADIVSATNQALKNR